jgi:hypothetical protein
LRRHLFNQLARLTPSITRLRDRFFGTRRPLSRYAITLSPYCQRRFAVARPIPKRQQIAFHSSSLSYLISSLTLSTIGLGVA